MKFYQEKWTITNSTWYDENRRPAYKVFTPFKLSNRTSTIVKFLIDATDEVRNPSEENVLVQSDEQTLNWLHHDGSGGQSSTENIDPDKYNDGEAIDTTNEREEPDVSSPGSFSKDIGSKFIYIAQIDWRFFTSSKFRFGDGLEVMAKDFYRKEGWGPYGRHRVFTAKDGSEYKWLEHSFYSELITNDGNKTVLAKSAQKSFGLIGKSHPGYLEIFPPGEHMVDEIFVTFIYVEKLRKDNEDAAK